LPLDLLEDLLRLLALLLDEPPPLRELDFELDDFDLDDFDLDLELWLAISPPGG
jgi:hypothetical protein